MAAVLEPSDRKFKIGWIQGKRDAELENRISHWITQVSEQKPGEGQSFGEWLRDGTVLCRLIAKLDPESHPHLNKHTQFGDCSNIEEFLWALRHFGIPESDLFDVRDLWNGQNLARVASTLNILAHMANAKDSKIPLPH